MDLKNSTTQSESKEIKQGESPSLEISLLGERFRLRPTVGGLAREDASAPHESHPQIAREAIEWANRQIHAAEKRLKSSPQSQPRAHHVALLALVELAHEALMERNRTAESLNGLIARLENLKALRASTPGVKPIQTDVPPSGKEVSSLMESAEAVWLEDQPSGAAAFVPPA